MSVKNIIFVPELSEESRHQLSFHLGNVRAKYSSNEFHLDVHYFPLLLTKLNFIFILKEQKTRVVIRTLIV